ncbi:hypothetical protein KBW71_11530 [Hydrogenophaga aromaticivorans]|uniref:head-tail joining protein n=1 Tax=Hydrogenophaga aromaticivorans TaxID=2610898 RepID=UPI001B3795FB|nr:hypothetical protein [Hydrogenophaga aromaticivorans]MBQ0919068.1 hypothetical protein [Hydrogenophaga aromaticivorans]
MLLATDRLSRINGAVERAHANVEVVHSGGEPFGAILDRAASDPFGGRAVDSATMELGFVAARAPGLVEGGELLVNGVAHVVKGGVQPDETGWLKVNVYPKA